MPINIHILVREELSSIFGGIVGNGSLHKLCCVALLDRRAGERGGGFSALGRHARSGAEQCAFAAAGAPIAAARPTAAVYEFIYDSAEKGAAAVEKTSCIPRKSPK